MSSIGGNLSPQRLVEEDSKQATALPEHVGGLPPGVIRVLIEATIRGEKRQRETKGGKSSLTVVKRESGNRLIFSGLQRLPLRQSVPRHHSPLLFALSGAFIVSFRAAPKPVRSHVYRRT